MDYERIEKVQTGIISPTKLRMKLMGPHHNRKKDGSNSNSSRTSPSRLDVEDTEFAKNSLLASKNDFEEDPREPVLDLSQSNQASNQRKERLVRESGEMGLFKMHQFAKGDLNSIHSMRMLDDENLDYDSNASSSSFEFHRGERSAHNSISRPYSRPMPSKWNDAEKWIMNRQNSVSKKNTLYNQGNRMPARVAPESANYDHSKPMSMMMMTRAADTKRVDCCQPAQHAFEKFSFVPSGSSLVDQSTQSKDLKELSCTKSSSEDTIIVPTIRSVCMRDMGTEMTPATSLEPSRTATPVGATTPLRSPTSSIPSTPRTGEAPAPTTAMGEEDLPQHPSESGKRELSEQEIKQKTRREIMALGVQLGKMNIAAWASKEEPDKNNTDSGGKVADVEELEHIEFEKRAATWEEAEKSKHSARYKREEIKIQAWESQQKAKLEAEMRRIEAKVEQMRAQGQAKMVRKIAMARQRSEEKRAAAEARKNQDAERAAAQAEYIRQTGRIPSSNHMCCGLFS